MRLFLFLILLSVPAYAQEEPPAEKASEDEAQLIIPPRKEIQKEEFCRQVVAHRLDEDVTYQPGIDVHGNEVAPADLSPRSPFVQEFVVIPLTVDLAQQLDQDLPEGTELDAYLSDIAINTRTGEVTVNGQDITEKAVVLCRE